VLGTLDPAAHVPPGRAVVSQLGQAEDFRPGPAAVFQQDQVGGFRPAPAAVFQQGQAEGSRPAQAGVSQPAQVVAFQTVLILGGASPLQTTINCLPLSHLVVEILRFRAGSCLTTFILPAFEALQYSLAIAATARAKPFLGVWLLG